MNKNVLLALLVPILILASCTKETTETKTTTVKKPYVAPTLPFWGSWKLIEDNPTSTEITYYDFNVKTGYCSQLYQNSNGLRDIDYSTISGTDQLIRYDWNSFQPYTISGDTLTVYNSDEPGQIEERMVRVPSDSINTETWIPALKIEKTVMIPSLYGINTNASFSFGGDFIFANLRNSTYRFYQINTLTGIFTDSANAPVNTWYSLYYKTSTNKLYHTRTSGTYNLQQRTGLNGASSNLSSNSINSVRSISANASSGTVYAYRGGQLYSGTEGGNFSSLTSFSGSYPDMHVYYKNDQFLGEYSSDFLIQFEIAPAYKILKQYRLPTGSDFNRIYTVASNGSDVWVLARRNSDSRYAYLKVSLP